MNITINISEDLYRQAMAIAEAHRIAVDEVFASAFIEQQSVRQRLQLRAARGDRAKFLAALDQVPNIEPEEYDRI